MTKEQQPNLRLSFRVEGDWWVAYAAPLTTMDGAVTLAKIHMAAVRAKPRKEAFMALMRDIIDDYIRDTFRQEATWGEPEVAPEHERSGRA